LTLSDDKNLCFCFACGGGSDAIAFVEQKFGLSFADAIERIAAKHNIEVEYDNIDPEEALRAAKQRREAFTKLNEENHVFRQNLRSQDLGLQARQWLISRDILPETSREFALGYAANGYFGGRVTVPIHDHRGALVGFTGRNVTGNPEAQKYKNSATSEIFNKGSLVFNEHRIAEACRLSSRIIFVEGHFDVITMWQHGIRNAVATQGTAGPTIESLKRLSRHCRTFVLCYDGDAGGIKAVDNFISVASDMIYGGDLNVVVADLPEGTDPDSCLRDGIDIVGIIENAKQWIEWEIDRLVAGLDYGNTHQFAAVEKQIRSMVSRIKSHALRQYYIDKAAKLLSGSDKGAAKLAAEWIAEAPKTRSNQSWARPRGDWTQYQAERRLLRAYIHFPETRSRLGSIMSHLRAQQHSWMWQRITELQAHGAEINPDILKVILAVAEPDYVRALRPLLMPTIKLVDSNGILDHAERVLTKVDG
jgi:DNA primase